MNDLQRLVFNNTPIYIAPDRPDWLVPNRAGDALLLRGAADAGSPADLSPLGITRHCRFLSLLPEPAANGYTGRKDRLSLSGLEECWLHITDRCNLACRHCLFACSPETRTTLPLEAIAAAIAEASRLGVHVFYLTGGEPLLHPDFTAICRLILDRPDTALVILTNGLLIPSFAGLFESLPTDRLYLQISIDGREEAHDRVRGNGAFRKLMPVLETVHAIGSRNTLAMAVHAENIDQMDDIVRLAAKTKINSVHYLWLLAAGNARNSGFVPSEQLFEGLLRAATVAADAGISIDNLTNMESRVFSPPGTRHDLGSAGWTSIAIGPDGGIHPTPALIGQAEVFCGHLHDGLETVWRRSPVLNRLRGQSLIHSDAYNANPLRFIIGGGDIDHSFYAGGKFIGHDPYVPLYNRMALWLIHRAAKSSPESPHPGFRLRMGDRLDNCHHDGNGVVLTRSNCVLTVSNGRKVVGDFYTRAADAENEEIANPVCYPEEAVSHIPRNIRVRSYGCGSPVLDAGPDNGDVVVDLGSGAGVECFIAARQVGPGGRVFGIDMLDSMLARANRSRSAVAETLGYGNVHFIKGYLETIPLGENTVDLVISNCVINLSGDKRRTFSEILRVLRPGGRMVVSDVVTDAPVPAAIGNDEKLRGECIAGAMVQPYLVAVLEETGFRGIRIMKRFFYREVQGHRFYSVTYTAFKPKPGAAARVVYPGPFAAVITDNGDLLVRGDTAETDWNGPADDCPPLLLLDEQGNAENIDARNSCACYAPPETAAGGNETAPPGRLSPRHRQDCTHCGKPLVYLATGERKNCILCGGSFPANAVCEAGHFVCDTCHGGDVAGIVKEMCRRTRETDLFALMESIRRHPAFPVHGPEHHFTVPAVILAAYRNAGGHLPDEAIATAIERGRSVPGGVCAFWGACGAAVGVGIAFAILLEGNPLKPEPRQVVQELVRDCIDAINRIQAARCCQRESYTALAVAAERSEKLLPVRLTADGPARCQQQARNRECIGGDCPFA